jgi:hypothetical protein
MEKESSSMTMSEELPMPSERNAVSTGRARQSARTMGMADARDEQQELLDLHLALPLADDLVEQMHRAPAHGDDFPLVQQVDEQRDEESRARPRGERC